MALRRAGHPSAGRRRSPRTARRSPPCGARPEEHVHDLQRRVGLQPVRPALDPPGVRGVERPDLLSRASAPAAHGRVAIAARPAARGSRTPGSGRRRRARRGPGRTATGAGSPGHHLGRAGGSGGRVGPGLCHRVATPPNAAPPPGSAQSSNGTTSTVGRPRRSIARPSRNGGSVTRPAGTVDGRGHPCSSPWANSSITRAADCAAAGRRAGAVAVGRRHSPSGVAGTPGASSSARLGRNVVTCARGRRRAAAARA